MNKEIPYTVNEARLAAQDNLMDQYHKELILFLCDKIDELEEDIALNEKLDKFMEQLS